MVSARLGCAFLVAISMAAPAVADVTVRQKIGGKVPMGGPIGGEQVLMIKGARMRTDGGMLGEGASQIIDLNTNQMIVLNAKRREADVYDMAKVGAEVSKIASAEVQAKVTPTTQTRQIAGSSCTVHNLAVTVPVDMGGEKLQLMISGPVCASKSAPGQADFATFYKTAAEKGAFFGDARAAKAQPGQAKAMATFQKEMANLGIPLAQEMNIAFQGSGPMAGMMGKLGGTSLTTETLSIAADPIPDSSFEIPAGYKVNKR